MNLQKRLTLPFAILLATSSLGAQNAPESAYQSLNPGDQLVITVWRKPELSCECVIAGNGTVLHPLYREVSVSGLSIPVVEERLRAFLARYEQNPQFVIQPLVKIIIGGEVRSPAIYTVPPETTIAQAIALAGGTTERGQLNKVKIIRDMQEIKLDVSKPDSDTALLQIRSGDQLLIGRRGVSTREIIAPVASTIAAVAGIAGIFLR